MKYYFFTCMFLISGTSHSTESLAQGLLHRTLLCSTYISDEKINIYMSNINGFIQKGANVDKALTEINHLPTNVWLYLLRNNHILQQEHKTRGLAHIITFTIKPEITISSLYPKNISRTDIKHAQTHLSHHDYHLIIKNILMHIDSSLFTQLPNTTKHCDITFICNN